MMTTGAATTITLTGAIVPGTVDPNGAPTPTTSSTARRCPMAARRRRATPATARTRSRSRSRSTVTASIPLTGLTSDTTYHFRLVATHAAGIGRGADRTLRTARPATPPAPTASTGAIQGLTATTVTLAGTVNPRGTAARYRFEYGTGASLDRRTVYEDAGNGTTTALPVSTALTLTPNTRYRYRVVATSAAGAARGGRRTFTTPRAAAALTMAAQSDRVSYGVRRS